MNDTRNNSDSANAIAENEFFFDYQMSVSLNFIRLVICILGLFNLVLLFVDFFNIDDVSAKLVASMLRIVFILLIVVLIVFIKRIKSFKVMSYIITAYELAAVIVFLFVYSLYDSPDFLIQLMGVMIIIIAIFLIPNQWINMLILSVAVAFGLFAYTYIMMEVNGVQFVAGMIYVAVEILLCGVFAYYFKRYQQGEYIVKTELLRIYSTDPLTKVGNRIKLQEEAEKWIEFCSRHNLDLSLVVADIDNMKTINDKHGHLVGDVILYETAQIMSDALRKNDVCVRWGGDEFILLLPYTNVEQANKLCDRIQNMILVHEIYLNYNITCSFGISSMKKGDRLSRLIEQADESMYNAKKLGKNCIEIVD